MRNFSSFLFTLIITILLIGCSAEPTLDVRVSTPSLAPAETITSVEAVEQHTEAPYPGPATPADQVSSGEDAYPAPQETESGLLDEPLGPINVPSPSANTGVVTGRLVTGSDRAPYIASIYLATLIQPDQEGYPPLIAFSEETDPLADQDSTGQFVFIDVPPGEYALAIWTPVGSTIVERSEEEGVLYLKVEAGEVTDLGTIVLE